MKILTVIGARPQFIKAATVTRRLRRPDFAGAIDEVIVHTGQHYDANLSEVFFQELEISPAAHHLGVGSGTQAAQTAAMMVALEPVVAAEAPDMVLVYGDTNSTLAGALVAAKAGVTLAHVEAGLRSGRRGMAEEVNRVVTDRLADLLFCPTVEAVRNLANEGRTDAHLVGDVMLDGFNFALGKADNGYLRQLDLHAGQFALATIHRAESTDSPERLETVFATLDRFTAHMPVLLPLHPRTRRSAEVHGLPLPPRVRIVDPLPYLAMTALLSQARLVATDSGGLQKEASFARVPCVTLRDETEWLETVESGWNTLPDMTVDGIEAALERAMTKPATDPPNYGNGDAAGLILRVIRDWAQ